LPVVSTSCNYTTGKYRIRRNAITKICCHMNDIKPTQIHFFSEGFKEAEFLAKFSYPEAIVAAAYELNVKVWHVLRAFEVLNEELGNKAYVEKILSIHTSDLVGLLNKPPDKGPYVVYFNNYRVSFAVEVLFFEIKALLDFFATKIILKALKIDPYLHTFKSKGSGEEYDPGGRFLDVLENNSPKESKNKAAAIAGIIKKHKPLWIDAVIKDRNKATHKGTLQTKIAMNSGLLQTPITNLTFQTFFEEENMADFSNKLAKQFLEFLQEILQEIIKE